MTMITFEVVAITVIIYLVAAIAFVVMSRAL